MTIQPTLPQMKQTTLLNPAEAIYAMETAGVMATTIVSLLADESLDDEDFREFEQNFETFFSEN